MLGTLTILARICIACKVFDPVPRNKYDVLQHSIEAVKNLKHSVERSPGHYFYNTSLYRQAVKAMGAVA